MDPISAVGLAGDAIAFIDFGLKFCSEWKEVYQSDDGISKKNIALEHTSAYLSDICQRLSGPLSSGQKPGASADHDCRAIWELSKHCRSTAQELEGMVRTLRVAKGNKTWQSFRTILRTEWLGNDIKELGRRMSMYR